jgi:hypothetical protein
LLKPPDDCADLVVCGLALPYLPTLGPVTAKFARVLRPDGYLVISRLRFSNVSRTTL